MKQFFTLCVAFMASIMSMTAQTMPNGPVRAERLPAGTKPFSLENVRKSNYVPMSLPIHKAAFGGKDDHADVYGYILYDQRYRSYTWSKFNTSDPMGYSMIRDYGTAQGADVIQTATFVGDRIFAQRCYLQWMGYWQPRSFGWYDPETTEFEDVFEWTDTAYTLFRDMTYDPVSDMIYLIDAEDGFQKSHLYVIDPHNPTTVTLACSMDYGIVMIAADNGYIYGLIPNDLGDPDPNNYNLRAPKTNTRLVKINTTSINQSEKTCTVEEIRPSGMNVAVAYDRGDGIPTFFWQSMEIDKINHRLWWNCNGADQQSYLCEIDIKTGALLSKQLLSTNPEFVGMSIPYQTAAAGAPSYVRSLQGEAGSNGALTASFTWKNPSQTFMKTTLTQLSGVKVYRDNQLITTVPTFSPGADASFADTDVPTGNHTYKFVAFNNEGDGIYKDIDLYVGHDTPSKVKNLTLAAEGNVARINWDAPTEGKQGGWIDPSSMTYKIVRYPDRVVLADAVTATTYADNTITTYEGYYYEVTPSNNDGVGEASTTKVVPMGPALAVPYTNNLSSQGEFNIWTIVDNNNFGYGDGTTWEFDSFRGVAMYYGMADKANDYLISPKFNFEAGKEYQIRYTYYTINWVYADTREPVKEEMQVYYGQQPTASGMSTLINDIGEFFTASEIYLYGKDNFTPQTGDGYVAFKATSPGDRGMIFLKDFSIREYGDKDLSVSNFTTSTIANATVRQESTVEVSNEGKVAQSNYTVEVFDVTTGEVLGTAQGIAVNPGEKVDVRVGWTPEDAVDITISARVLLDGDTYPEDNTWKNGVLINVASADGARWFAANVDDKHEDPLYGTLGVGWNGPFHMTYNCNQTQQIFLESQMRKHVFLKGVQFVYDGNPGLVGKTTNVTVSIKQTNRTTTEDEYDFGYGVFDTDGWTVVYSGPITFDSAAENSMMTIMFDAEYSYEGGNIIVKYERPSDNKVDGEISPYWHMNRYQDGEQRRVAWYHGANYNITLDWIFTDDQESYTRFAYRDNEETAVRGVETRSVEMMQRGDNIFFGGACDTVELYNAAGARVAAANNTPSINTRTLPKGVYTIKVSLNGNISTRKIVIR